MWWLWSPVDLEEVIELVPHSKTNVLSFLFFGTSFLVTVMGLERIGFPGGQFVLGENWNWWHVRTVSGWYGSLFKWWWLLLSGKLTLPSFCSEIPFATGNKLHHLTFSISLVYILSIVISLAMFYPICLRLLYILHYHGFVNFCVASNFQANRNSEQLISTHIPTATLGRTHLADPWFWPMSIESPLNERSLHIFISLDLRFWKKIWCDGWYFSHEACLFWMNLSCCSCDTKETYIVLSVISLGVWDRPFLWLGNYPPERFKRHPK